MKVFSRARAGLRRPVGSYAQNGRVTAASIHHGGDVGAPLRRFANASARWRSFQSWHINGNGWTDVGYHFGVDGLGRLYEGRPVGAVPAAVGGHNTGSVAIVFMQDGRYHGLTWQQRRTLKELFVKGLPSHGVPPLRTLTVKGHREFSGHATNACPGDKIMRHLAWRRKQRNR